IYFLASSVYILVSHSFPTRRSSDLEDDDSSAYRGAIATGHGEYQDRRPRDSGSLGTADDSCPEYDGLGLSRRGPVRFPDRAGERSEEHTSELQSRVDLVCRLLLEKK